MGRPAVSVHDLLETGGLTLSDVMAACDEDTESVEDLLHPIRTTWPTGFSCLSFIAQFTMLGICKDAGLGQELVLSADVATPFDSSLLMAVATDDQQMFGLHMVATDLAMRWTSLAPPASDLIFYLRLLQIPRIFLDNMRIIRETI